MRILFTVLALLAWLFLIAPALAQDATPAAPGTHTVQAGETLSEIAKQHEIIVEQLMRLNGIPNPNAIYVGQELRLPVIDRPPGVTIHIVRSGESLSVIAKQYGVAMRTLMTQNGIANANNIVTGMELTIPDVTPTPAATGTAPETVATAAPTFAPSPVAIIGEPVVMNVVTMDSLKESSVTPTVVIVPTSTALPPTPVIPPTATPAEGPVPDATLESGLWVHVVLPGETASEIAKAYGVSTASLLRVNGIADANLIRAGANLVIPGSADWVIGEGAPADAATPEAMAEATTAEATGDTQGEPLIVAAMTPTPDEPLPTQIPPTDASTDAPSTDALTTVLTPVPMSERPASSLNRSYNIVYGDTLAGIALRVGVDVNSLARLNNLETDDPLRAGDSLLLPATDRELRVVTDAQEYVVQPGDSLSEIAKNHNLSLAELMTANRIVNPNIVSVGERLEIPGRALNGEGPLTRVGPARSGYYFYTVRPGDTLSELAADLNSTEIALMEYNNISDVATIFNGMELRVPFGAPPLPKRAPPVPLSGSSFVVSLSRQQCWVFSGREIRYAWNCSTGYGQWRTRTGSFAVQSKIDMAKSNVWRLDMPYWLGIYDVGSVENGIHGLPISWRTGRKIWTELIGEPATFGCAMLGDEDALTLFTLAYIGMPVHIIQ